MIVRLPRSCDAGNTSTCLFGSTLALHSIEFWVVRFWRASQEEPEESAKLGDGAHFGSEERQSRTESEERKRTKRKFAAKNETELGQRLADRTSPVLVCQHAVGSRARRCTGSRHERLLSRLDPS